MPYAPMPPHELGRFGERPRVLRCPRERTHGREAAKWLAGPHLGGPVVRERRGHDLDADLPIELGLHRQAEPERFNVYLNSIVLKASALF